MEEGHGLRAPSEPLVLALEKENKTKRGKLKQCCSVCNIGQRCTKSDKVYQTGSGTRSGRRFAQVFPQKTGQG